MVCMRGKGGMPQIYRTRDNSVKVRTTISIRYELYMAVKELADMSFGGEFSKALEFIIEMFVRLRPVISQISKAPEKEIRLIIQSSDQGTKTKKHEKSESDVDKEFKEVVNEAVYVEVRDKLAGYVEMLRGFATQLHNFIVGKKFGRVTVKPDFTHIRKKLDEVRKEVQKVLKDKSIPKTQELKDLIEEIHDLMKEIGHLLKTAESL